MSAVRQLPKRATLDDLMRYDGKAELIGGKVVPFMASGVLPHMVGLRITMSLMTHAAGLGRGMAFADGIGFAVPELPSGRESFSPDASYYTGPMPTNMMRFIEGTPDFAVEVRSENDYGRAAEAQMAAKRADYFAAGTKVVWDVDPVAGVIDCYSPDSPETPVRFARGQTANAEPAVPGWAITVDSVIG